MEIVVVVVGCPKDGKEDLEAALKQEIRQYDRRGEIVVLTTNPTNPKKIRQRAILWIVNKKW